MPYPASVQGLPDRTTDAPGPRFPMLKVILQILQQPRTLAPPGHWLQHPGGGGDEMCSVWSSPDTGRMSLHEYAA
jgi:hypothetical protein